MQELAQFNGEKCVAVFYFTFIFQRYVFQKMNFSLTGFFFLFELKILLHCHKVCIVSKKRAAVMLISVSLYMSLFSLAVLRFFLIIGFNQFDYNMPQCIFLLNLKKCSAIIFKIFFLPPLFWNSKCIVVGCLKLPHSISMFYFLKLFFSVYFTLTRF